EADPGRSRFLAEPANDDLVSVLEKPPRLAAGECKGLSAAPRQLEEAPSRVPRRARYGARPEQISRAEVAPVARVTGDELRHRPIQVAQVGPADDERRLARRAHAR